MESSKKGMWKGYHLLIEGVRKGSLPYKHLLSTPSPPPHPPAPGYGLMLQK